MSIQNLLLTEKYRPRKIDDMILVPRIKKNFENGLNENYIFYGHFGTGKSTLSRILIGRYSKTTPYLELNSSLATSIDILRSKVEEFCSKIPISFDIDKEYLFKYVFLDEFERVSSNYQDAFKAFVEEYSAKNVRFILSTNNISKVMPGIKSRFTEINFDCQNIEEEKFVKREIYKRVKDIILKEENFDIDKENLIKIINKRYPDIRKILNDIQHFKITGDLNSSINDTKTKISLYNIIFDKSLSYDDIYHFYMDNFGPEKLDIMISNLGSDFIKWIIIEKKNDVKNLFKANYVISDYSRLIETTTDPVIVGMTLIGKMRDIFLN